MAQISMASFGLRAFNANGYPVSGALCYVYEAGTTTPVTTFADKDLTTPQEFPVPANANGGFPEIYVPDGFYKIDLTDSASASLPGFPKDNLTLGFSPVAMLSFASRAQAVAAISSGVLSLLADGTTIIADGLIYQKMASSHPMYGTDPIADMPGFAPADIATLRHFGVAADGATDNAAKISAWITYMDGAKVRGYVHKGTHLVSYVRNRALVNSLDIECHPEATFKGSLTKQVFAGDDAITSLTVTDFTAGNDGFVVVYTTGGVDTVWDDGAEYTATGQTIDLSTGSAPHGALATGDSVRVVSADPIIELGQGSGRNGHFEWRGGTIDNSLRGFAGAKASGSGLTILNFSSYRVSEAVFKGADDWETAIEDSVSDSGFTALYCDRGEVVGNTFIGQADLGIYITGGASTGVADDGYTHEIHGNLFDKCQTGGKSVRQTPAAHVHGNTFNQCYNGWLVGGVSGGGPLTGASATITGNTFLKMAKRAVDARRVKNVIVTDNRIVDFGRALDGATEVNGGGIAIEFWGVNSGTISGNIIRLDAFSPGASKAIDLHDENTLSTMETDNVMVVGNFIDGPNTGVSERDSGTGNVIRENNIINTAVPVNVPSTRRWQYRASNVEVEGIGATLFEGSDTDQIAFLFGTPEDSSVSYTTRTRQWARSGNIVTVSFEINGAISWTTPPSGTFRLDNCLPFPPAGNSPAWGGLTTNVNGSIGDGSPTTYLAATAVSSSNSQVQFIKMVPGADDSTLTAADVVAAGSGSTFRLRASFSYRCAAEAQN